MMRKTDDSGQWLLLMGIVAGVGMAVLLVFVNQSVMAGSASSSSIVDFPKNDIREIRSEVVNEAYALGIAANKEGSDYNGRSQAFKDSFDLYFKADLEHMYAMKGVDLDVDAQPHQTGDMIGEVALEIYYSDGGTTYTEKTVVYLL
ncbi:hypothetical protein [Methanocella arvoryzae]|uniref:Uncharacterized protein n=1 Tax=Methanocella arvoryzae (strain DSM 22066 / NBRC 105507 / MRE50) TaxID=351160 RepID=Q0W728_METAR|nr:hypothetical protein [Methanocella arvoryzae]CAJ35815.1 conserved hypothetical protein [Methanocella arvoryzae MRE50]